MEGEPGLRAAPSDDPSRSVLDCALRCLTAPGPAALPLGALLGDLARAFAADGAGVAQLPGGQPVARFGAGHAATTPLPWGERPEVLRELASSPTAVGVRAGGGHWLLTAIDGDECASWLLWLEAPAEREWSPAEAAALALTGQALARHLRRPDQAPRWARQLLGSQRQRRFDEAAAAARRIAHDYGNILAAVLGFSELSLGQLPPSGPCASYLKEIYRAAQVGERLTSTLRLFARRHWPRNQPARLAAVVAAEARRLRGTFPEARLEVALPPDLPPVGIDAEPLRHLLSQLLDNAAEATATAARIRLSARLVSLGSEQCLDLFGPAEPGPHVEVAVEDSGCGLSADARRRLLAEPFFTTKTRHRGYGLAVVHGILTAHRGGLLIESAGAGTVVRTYLPVAAPAPAAPAQQTSAVGPHEPVLVVDDDPLILELVRTTLQRAGYRVATATSAEEAIRSFRRAAEPFRLVLSDVVMPDVNGYDMARRLQAHDAGVNVLFMSGQVVPDSGRPPLPGDMFDLLAKPFRPEGLLRAVRSALERGPRRPPAAKGTGDDVVHTPTR
jgi:signal transduction histidine kinase/ActR/RegA family two-component response regulator